MSCLPQTPERRTGEGSKVRSEASRAHGWARPIRATPGGDHSCTRQVRTAPRVFCHHGLFGRWTVRNPLGAALSSARTALTRMFFDARTSHQVRCAPREARRSLPRPWSSAFAPVVLHGGNEPFVMVLYQPLIELARSVLRSNTFTGVESLHYK